MRTIHDEERYALRTLVRSDFSSISSRELEDFVHRASKTLRERKARESIDWTKISNNRETAFSKYYFHQSYIFPDMCYNPLELGVLYQCVPYDLVFPWFLFTQELEAYVVNQMYSAGQNTFALNTPIPDAYFLTQGPFSGGPFGHLRKSERLADPIMILCIDSEIDPARYEKAKYKKNYWIFCFESHENNYFGRFSTDNSEDVVRLHFKEACKVFCHKDNPIPFRFYDWISGDYQERGNDDEEAHEE